MEKQERFSLLYSSVSQPFFRGGTCKIIFPIPTNTLPIKTFTGQKIKRQLVTYGVYSIVASCRTKIHATFLVTFWNYSRYLKIFTYWFCYFPWKPYRRSWEIWLKTPAVRSYWINCTFTTTLIYIYIYILIQVCWCTLNTHTCAYKYHKYWFLIKIINCQERVSDRFLTSDGVGSNFLK